MKPTRVARLALPILFLIVATARGLSSDPDQPIEIEADFAELDDQEGRTTYTGNVIVTQGSIRMTGDKMRANFSPERELIDVYVEGRPAFFKQTPDGGKDDIEGEALEIEYHAQKNLLYLIRQARLTQGERLFKGYRINYDTEKSIITGRATPRDSGGETAAKEPPSRVKVIIPPRNKTAPDPARGETCKEGENGASPSCTKTADEPPAVDP